MTILLKSCPRCLGDLIEERLPGERDVVCLQCGYRRPILGAQFVAASRMLLQPRNGGYPAAA